MEVIKLSKINVTVSTDAKNVLTNYQDMYGIENLDSALEAVLIGFGSLESVRERLESFRHGDESIADVLTRLMDIADLEEVKQ